MNNQYDAILILSFGAPECLQDIEPFLQNVTAAKSINKQRLFKVMEHYRLFNGKSPLNQQCQSLIAALNKELKYHRINLPIYLGNLYWHPMLFKTIEQLQRDNKKNILLITTSLYSSFASCRKYLLQLQQYKKLINAQMNFAKIDHLFKQESFIKMHQDLIENSINKNKINVKKSVLLLSAHSIPVKMAQNSLYQQQLLQIAKLITKDLSFSMWKLVFQSKSGNPKEPWLGPDLDEEINLLSKEKYDTIIVSPIGFMLDNMETKYDIGVQARKKADKLGFNFYQIPAIVNHPQFTTLIVKRIIDKINKVEPESIVHSNLLPPCGTKNCCAMD